VANRLRGILRVDPASWTPEFMIPITTGRWHGIAWDDSHPGGAIWMVTGSSGIDRFVMQNGKLHHTTTSGLVGPAAGNRGIPGRHRRSAWAGHAQWQAGFLRCRRWPAGL
jgi:hypothetical protein